MVFNIFISIKIFYPLFYIMDLVKNLKKLKVEHVILCLVGALFLIFLINSYSNNKSTSAEQMSSRRTQEMYNTEISK